MSTQDGRGQRMAPVVKVPPPSKRPPTPPPASGARPADPVRPDPATRDLLAEAFEAGEEYRDVQHDYRTVGRNAPDFDAWLAAKFPPPLPDEPPDGTVCRGTGTDIWYRDDASGMKSSSTWWLDGDSHRYGAAIDAGLDPRRRLIELPAYNMDALRPLYEAVNAILDASREKGGFAVPHAEAAVISATVRALAERGNHDA